MTGYTSTKIIGTHRISKLATDQVQLNQIIGTNRVHLYQDESYNITKMIVTDQVHLFQGEYIFSKIIGAGHWLGTT